MIVIAGVIWLGASVLARIMLARALRFLTPEQPADVQGVRFEMLLFSWFLQFDLWIALVLIVFTWSGAPVAVVSAFLVALAGTVVLAQVARIRRIERLGLPRVYVKADQRAALVASAGPCALILAVAYGLLRQA